MQNRKVKLWRKQLSRKGMDWNEWNGRKCFLFCIWSEGKLTQEPIFGKLLSLTFFYGTDSVMPIDLTVG